MNTEYTTTKFNANGNTWSVTVAKGANNYVSVRKETNNPFKTLGKEFANFDAAVKHYKNPAMKTELLKIELGLI